MFRAHINKRLVESYWRQICCRWLLQLSDLHKQSVQQSLDQPDSQYQHYSDMCLAPAAVPVTAATQQHHHHHHHHHHRSVMALRIDTGEQLHEISPPPSPTTAAAGQSGYARDVYTPRRVKLLNLWARTRLFQKLMMFCVVVWISLIVHKAGIVQHLTTMNATASTSGALFDGDSASSSSDSPLSPAVHDDIVLPHNIEHKHDTVADDVIRNVPPPHTPVHAEKVVKDETAKYYFGEEFFKVANVAWGIFVYMYSYMYTRTCVSWCSSSLR